ncbi:MAG: hypothetical protein ABEK59_01415 [Halobacteria archaeon]
MKDLPREMLRRSLEDAVHVAQDVSEEEGVQFDDGAISQLSVQLYQVRLARMEQRNQQKRLQTNGGGGVQ